MNPKPKVQILGVKSILYSKGQNSTFDAVAKVLRTHRIMMKLFWSVILVTLLASCSYVLINALINYFAYEIVTTITVRNEIPSKMPTILICNSNGLMTPTAIYFASQVYALYGVTKVNNYLGFTYNQIPYPRILNNKASFLLPRTMAMTAALNPTLSDQFRQMLGLTLQQMLISCTFNSMECTAENFDWTYDSYFGNCFQFNASGHEKISQSGKFNGLQVELFVGQSITPEQVAQNNGVHIFIFNETVTTNPFSDGIDAAAGKETTIFLDKKRIHKIQKPYGACTPGLTSANAYPTYLYRLTFQIYNQYRQKDCFNSCFQQYLIVTMGCYSATFPYLKNTTTPACLIGMDLFNSLSLFTSFFISDVATKCSDCPQECDSEFYTMTTASLDYPTQIYADMLSSQSQIQSRFNNLKPTYQQLKQSIASVNINYNALSFTQFKENQKVTVIDLISSIGGTMGLFLGLSFLSMFEITEIFVELLFLLVEKYIFGMKT